MENGLVQSIKMEGLTRDTFVWVNYKHLKPFACALYKNDHMFWCYFNRSFKHSGIV